MTVENLLTWLAMWCLPSALAFAWMWADEWLACREESLSERHDRLDAEAGFGADLDGNVRAFDSMPKEYVR